MKRCPSCSKEAPDGSRYCPSCAAPLGSSDLSVWYAGNSLLGLAIALAPAVYGLYLSLAGRPLFREALLEA